MCSVVVVVFFFQAEDGIRDYKVTGVQTCALPISLQVVKAVTSFPEAKFMWSITANWGGFGGMVAKSLKERKRTTGQMYRQGYGAGSQGPGLQVFPPPEPPPPSPRPHDVQPIPHRRVPPQ